MPLKMFSKDCKAKKALAFLAYLKKLKSFSFVCAITTSLLAPLQSIAAEGGYSNYIPGSYGDFAAAMVPSTPLTIRNDFYYYNADIDKTLRNSRLELDAELTMALNLTTIVYKPDVEVFGAQYVFGAVVPLIKTEFDASINDISESYDTSGIGDITLVPAAFYWNSSNFHYSLAQYIVTPSASYDVEDDLNPGLNYWSFDTNFAATYLNLETGQDYSVNLGFIHNTENSETDYQTGNEVHIDYMFNQFLSETLAVGIHGFYLKQVSGDSGKGATLGSFKGRAAGIGPAVLWSTMVGQSQVSFIAKFLHEYKAENRLEGNHAFVSFAVGF